MAEYKRQTAKICRIGHILNGNYIQNEGWEPSFVETEVGEISRANIFAIVVGVEENSLTVDDGSGKISLRSFGTVPLDGFEIADKLLIISRPRMYNEEVYLAAEIVKKLENDKWLELRKLEIELVPKVKIQKKIVVQQPTAKVPEVDKTFTSTDDVLAKIRELDSGSGADIDEVAKEIEGGEEIIKRLMEEGEVFEITPGKVKVLE